MTAYPEPHYGPGWEQPVRRGTDGFAVAAIVTALLGLKVANNLYVQIGLVLLIALSAKNAILIVEMALEGRAAGKGLVEATVHASQARFRPIVMTSFTFILGVLPLLLARGAGASARKPFAASAAPTSMPPIPTAETCRCGSA